MLWNFIKAVAVWTKQMITRIFTRWSKELYSNEGAASNTPSFKGFHARFDCKLT